MRNSRPAPVRHRNKTRTRSAHTRPLEAAARVRGGVWRSARNNNFSATCKTINIENPEEKACRVNRPTPKPRREIGVRREISPIVPNMKPQAQPAKPPGTWPFSGPKSRRRKFVGEGTGAAVATRIQLSLGAAQAGIVTKPGANVGTAGHTPCDRTSMVATATCRAAR